MNIYTVESLKSLREKIDLVEIVSHYIDLKKDEMGHRANCPFHEDKSHNFFIYSGKNYYHCTGCGGHGDAIAFVMSYLKLYFIEAIETLANFYKIDMEMEDSLDYTTLHRPDSDEIEIIKLHLVESIIKTMQDDNLTEAKAAEIIKISPLQFNSLINGHFSGYTIFSLIEFLNYLGMDVDIMIRPNIINPMGKINVFHSS